MHIQVFLIDKSLKNWDKNLIGFCKLLSILRETTPKLILFVCLRQYMCTHVILPTFPKWLLFNVYIPQPIIFLFPKEPRKTWLFLYALEPVRFQFKIKKNIFCCRYSFSVYWPLLVWVQRRERHNNERFSQVFPGQY